MHTDIKERRVAKRRILADRRRKPLFGDVVERRQQADRRKQADLY